ncbi:MAG: MarR family transcriptional regulator, partial [Gemmatimonadetes bacterium]|nr:MarR family transcriptional regulator [Gemmatimonadota bacterium]
LSEAPDDALRMSDLARAASMSQSRLSHRMRRLVDRGLIEQRPCTKDGRVTYAALTADGRALIEAVAPEHVADVRALVFDALNDEQTLALAEALEAVRDGGRPPEPSTDQSA